ncbi:unnamed protein product [Prorocentrum cordatum]|uniref:Uncharacterized protein n=1 Tax=Prorocentrum cordatum TaxID=2364126 RepID=A0ABN9PNZ8_9DINO|nr:unnamed protein product [Polarella glacialis]
MPHVRSRYRAYMRQLRGFKGGFCSAPRPIPPPPGLEPRVQLTLQKLAPTTTDILLDYLAPKARKSISTRVASATVVSGDATKLSVRTRVAAVSIQGRTLASWGSDGLQLSATNDIAGISPHIPAEVSRVSSRRPPEPKNEDSNKDHDCQVVSLGSDGLQVVAADSIVGVSSHFPVDSASSSPRRPPEPKNEDSNKDHIMIVKWLLWDQMDCKRRRWTIWLAFLRTFLFILLLPILAVPRSSTKTRRRRRRITITIILFVKLLLPLCIILSFLGAYV